MPRVTTAGAIPVVLLLAVAALAWAVTADRMEGMDMGPGTDLGSFGWFAGVWAVMMAAMMLPSLVPMAGAYARREADEGGGARSVSGTFLFTLGYLAPWVLAGVGAWAVFEGIRSLDPAFLAWDEAGRYVAGGVIGVAAVYELTSPKAACLERCRNRQLLVDGWRTGPAGALRMGIGQGAYCIGCCWGLMAALFALGVMSITWMVVIAAVIAVEKLLPSRTVASGAVAALLMALAIGVAFFPDQLPGLTIPSSSMAMPGQSMAMPG
jgi:predicted metal-binding membrane protein